MSCEIAAALQQCDDERCHGSTWLPGFADCDALGWQVSLDCSTAASFCLASTALCSAPCNTKPESHHPAPNALNIHSETNSWTKKVSSDTFDTTPRESHLQLMRKLAVFSKQL